MKTATIDTAALWAGTISTWQDGDIFRETNTDTVTDSIADRLGYLKTKADAAGYIAAANTWTGENTFTTVASVTDFVVGGDGDMTVAAAATFNSTATFNSEVSAANVLLTGVVGPSYETLADSAASLSNVLVHRVPTLTANRVYTLPAGSDYQLALIVRNRTADAFTATLQTSTPTTLGVISASSAGWILVQKKPASVWVVVAWGGTVTSLDTTV